MNVDIDTGLLEGARQIPSPNCDERPCGGEIDLLVIHGISLPPGEFGGTYIDQLFTNQLQSEAHPYFEEIQDLKVSSHVLIRRTGEVVQFVPFNYRAWHAGKSCYEGREYCNDFSLAIELEGTDDLHYEDGQYQNLVQVILAVMDVYPSITQKRIVGHCHISPGRKTDPGESFDWQRLFAAIAKAQDIVDGTTKN